MIEKRYFYEGMDSDTAHVLMSDKASLNLMNCRMGVTQYGRLGRIENTPGSTQISQTVFPPYGSNLTIGAVSDDSRNRVIFFNYNTFGYHGIYCLDYSSPDTPIVYAVLYSTQINTGLNFDKTYRIDRNAKVVGDLLYWTDGSTNEVRRTNIEAGIKMNHPSYSTTVTPYSYPMNESVITLIRRPYGLGLTATKGTAGGFSNKFIQEFAGQFASQLQYRDGELSVLSVPTEMVNYNLYTDTYNFIQITFPLSETFDQDVQVIRLAVRYGNTPKYFIIKEWNKNNPTDLAEINSHNAGVTNLTYNFYNNESGIALSNEDSVKQSDNIGREVQTIETALNRLFLANYKKGYNSPSYTTLAASLNTNGSDPDAATALKCNSSYQIAIRFRDYYKRMCAYVTNTNCVLSTPDRSYSSVPYNNLSWTLSNTGATNQIPSWAYYYDILITKNLRTRNFQQNLASNLQYVVKNQDGTYTYQNTYSGAIYALAVDISILANSGAGYTLNTDDLCRLYLSTTATVYEQSVIGQEGNYLFVTPINLGSFSTMPGCYFEIYTPYFSSDDETFYTCGQSYKITNAGTGSRTFSTTSGIINGDITRFKTTINIIIGTITLRNEAMSPNSNNWQNWFQFYGEPNFMAGQLGEVTKQNFIQYSNTRIQGSLINGLSTFDDLDEKATPESIGALRKLQNANKITEEGNVMLAIGEKETCSLYLGEVQVVGASANAFLASAPNVIGTINILKGSYGTINPESVIQYLGSVYWVDVSNGAAVQYSSEGLERISKFKMGRFFKNYCLNYAAASTGNIDNINGFHHIPSCVDPFHKEVVFTLPGLIYSNYANTLPSYSSVPPYATSIINRFDIYDSLQKTMCYSYEENKWGSNFEHIAEMYCYMDNVLFSFKNGVPYTLYTNTTNWNTFYGVQYPVRMCFLGNVNPSAIKQLNNISVESNAAPNFTVGYADYPNVQITDLTDDDYTDQEGIFYADFFMDRLDPNATGTADERLYTGSSITDKSVKIMLEFQQYSSLFYCNFVNLGYSISRGQKQILNPVN